MVLEHSFVLRHGGIGSPAAGAEHRHQIGLYTEEHLQRMSNIGVWLPKCRDCNTPKRTSTTTGHQFSKGAPVELGMRLLTASSSAT